MGQKMCKGDPFVSVQKTLAQIRDVIACDGGDDDQGDAELMMGSAQPYAPVQDKKGKDLSYTGLPGTPVVGGAAANTQRQSLPGESVVVTYDVMGQSNRLTPPGESMLVTSPFGISGGTPRSGSMGLVTAEKTLGSSLEPTKSFDVKAPFKIGDKVEIWSQSNNVWCMGTVQKYQGEYVQISYKSPSGQMISKVMPNGHEHLRFHGHYHGGGDSNSAANGFFVAPVSPGGSLSPEKRMPSYGSPKPTSPPREIAPGINSPVAANGAYRVGDKIQIYSTSQNTWVDGSVSKSDGEWITISYKGPGGQAMTKIMPNGHEHVRASQGSIFGSTLPEMTPTLLPLTETALDSRPPPPSQAYKVGDYVEIFSASQNTWCKGQISKVDGEYVHVAYRGTKGEPMNKIMPNGHAQLRLLRT